MSTLSARERDLPTRTILKNRNLELIFAVAMIIMTGISALTPAFPELARSLGVSESRVGLLVTVYTLPGIFLAPLLGTFADRHGRKRVLVAALLLFGLAGGACAFANSFTLLLVLRAVQGVGLAPLFLISLTIIGDLFDGEARTKAMGYNTTVIGLSAALYPALGGGLALLNPQLPFALAFLALPVGGLLIPFLNIPEPKNHQDLKQYFSGVLASAKDREAICLLVLTAGAQLVLVGGFLNYAPILLESSLGASALVIGVVLAARSVALSVTSSLLGKLAAKVSQRRLIKGSFVLSAAALLLFPLLSTLGSPYWLLLPAVVYGLAHGLNFPNTQTLLAGAAPPTHRAAFLSLRSSVKRVGQTLGPLVMAAVYGLWGSSAVFFVSAGIVLLLLVVALVMLE